MKKKIKTESIEDSKEKLNAKSSEDLDKKLTAELMEQEGMEENTELREMFKNSYFFPICYDDAIVGVNPMTESIIYDYMRVGQLSIMFSEWSYPDYGDTLDGCGQMRRWVENLSKGKAEPEAVEKIPPTLFLYKGNIQYWEDLNNPEYC